MAKATKETTMALDPQEDPIAGVQIRLDSALSKLDEVRNGVAELQRERDEAITLLQDALRIHDEWFNTPGDRIRAGEQLDRTRLWLQVAGAEAAWGDREDDVRRLVAEGLRVDGISPLQATDWRPEPYEDDDGEDG